MFSAFRIKLNVVCSKNVGCFPGNRYEESKKYCHSVERGSPLAESKIVDDLFCG